MAYQKYTDTELFLFRQKDKRIMWQSIFSSLCDLVQNEHANPSNNLDSLKEKAKELVAWLEKQYPTEEAGKTPEYKAEELETEIQKVEKHLEVLKNLKEGGPGF